MVYKNFSFSTPFLRGYKQLRIPIVDDGGNPEWPSVFPLEKIDEMRNNIPNLAKPDSTKNICDILMNTL